MSEGYFKWYRKGFENALWQEKRSLSRFEAWFDLVGNLAAYKPYEKIVKGRSIHLHLGELVASERFLETRWNWSRTKVRNFISLLEKNHSLTKRKDQGETVLTLCNYVSYNNYTTTEDTEEDTTDQTKREPVTNQREEDKEIKEYKKLKPCPKIFWNKTEGWIGIEDKNMNEWVEAYPCVDIKQTLKMMHQWLLANPSKSKKKQWLRFITNWLSKSQEQGGSDRSQGKLKNFSRNYGTENEGGNAHPDFNVEF